MVRSTWGHVFVWLVDKTIPIPSDANLVMEHVTFEHQCTMHLPSPKKRTVGKIKQGPQEMFAAPVLINKQPHQEADTAPCVREFEKEL